MDLDSECFGSLLLKCILILYSIWDWNLMKTDIFFWQKTAKI